MKKLKRVLITGGAGYIGTSLIPLLLKKGYLVTVYDSVQYDGNVLIPYFDNPNFSFINGDIVDSPSLKRAVKNQDIVIHLAAIVGYDACEKNKKMAKLVNSKATKNLVSLLTSKQLLLFGSTGSNYGKVAGVCTEETPLNPTSLYAETKTDAENYVMQHSNAIAYRFATAFGSAPRLRLDLLVNDLTFLAVKQKYMLVYQPEFMRTFIHVKDMANSFLFAIENSEKMKNSIYNVGSNNMNFTKREVCEMIRKKTGCVIYYNEFDSDKDHRDYEVSYNKINQLGFKTTISVEEGIDELLKVYQALNLKNKRHVNAGN